MEIITMPKLGESVHEGTIEEWLVKAGDTVSEYDPLCEVLTDKVTAEVPSSFDGTIKELLVEVGETINVGTPICKIEVAGSTHEDNDQEETKVEEIFTDSSKDETDTTLSTSKSATKKRISPVVNKLATEYNIDVENVEGSGKFGRVTKKDILNYIKSDMVETKNESNETVNTEPLKGEKIPIAGVRKAVAQNMVKSRTEIPHAWMMIEVDATNLVQLRNKYKEQFKQEGIKLTYFSFFVDAISKAIKKYPIVNSSWNEDHIKIHDDVNISIAVASEDHLYVPVIKNVDDLSVKGIAKHIETLASKGRQHKLTQEEMSAGTFTVNNTGAFGSVQSMGVINYPQSAILQVESIVKKPVFIDDMLAARYMVNLCLSIDHRVLDGLVAGQFLQTVKQNIESIDVNQSL